MAQRKSRPVKKPTRKAVTRKKGSTKAARKRAAPRAARSTLARLEEELPDTLAQLSTQVRRRLTHLEREIQLRVARHQAAVAKTRGLEPPAVEPLEPVVEQMITRKEVKAEAKILPLGSRKIFSANSKLVIAIKATKKSHSGTATNNW